MNTIYIIFILLSFNSVLAEGVVTSEIKPIVTVAPQYPTKAILERLEGFVSVEFVVDVNGGVKRVKVIDAEPKDIFNKVAVQAVSKYKFIPKIVDNKAVEQFSTQRIEFKLPEELTKKPLTLELLALKEPSDIPILAVYEMKIEEQNENDYINTIVYFKDIEINQQLLLWPNQNTQIPNFSIVQDKIIKHAKSSIIKTSGAFNQFQKMCISENCEPILLSKLNSLPFKDYVEIIKLKVEFIIDEEGNVKKFKIKKYDKKFKNKEAIKQMLSNLKFLPATTKNKSVSSKFTARLETFVTSQKNNRLLWSKEIVYQLKKPPNQWVRVAMLINKKGRVIEAQALQSSDKSFELPAINAVKDYKFKKNKNKYQLIKVIEFNQ